MHSGNSFQNTGFAVVVLQIFAVYWLPTKTITPEWKLSHGDHSGSRHLKRKVSNFLRLEKKFSQFSKHSQNILVFQITLFQGVSQLHLNFFLSNLFLNVGISLLNLWKQELKLVSNSSASTIKNKTTPFFFGGFTFHQ